MTQGMPRYQDLLASLENANRRGWFLLFVELLLIAVLGFLIRWTELFQQPLVPLIAIGGVAGPLLVQLLRLWAQNKKEIGDLKEQTRFGEFDKHNLRSLFQDTLRRLGLPSEPLPVFITADKSLNASAVKLGLGGMFRWLNGVYLHRQVLHRLTPREVQDILGHELGHYYRYFLVTDQYQGITLVLGALSGLWLFQAVDLDSTLGYAGTMCFPALFWTLATIPRNLHSQKIEFLCDCSGAEVHGIEVSIAGLLKIGIDAETQYAIHEQFMLSESAPSNLGMEARIAAIEAAIPYGHTSRETLEKLVEQNLRVHAKRHQQLSLIGFWNYAWRGDGDNQEAREELARRKKLLDACERLPWEQLVRDPLEFELTEEQIRQLVGWMEQRPHAVLFRIPESRDDSHPPIKDRILFLWHNRAELRNSAKLHAFQT